MRCKYIALPLSAIIAAACCRKNISQSTTDYDGATAAIASHIATGAPPAVYGFDLRGVGGYDTVGLGPDRKAILVSSVHSGAILLFDNRGHHVRTIPTAPIVSFLAVDIDADYNDELLTDERTDSGTGIGKRMFRLYTLRDSTPVWEAISDSYVDRTLRPVFEPEDQCGFVRIDPGYNPTRLTYIHYGPQGRTTEIWDIVKSVPKKRRTTTEPGSVGCP